MSGVGKGIATAALANLLQAKGYRVSAMKIDPYLNVDAGTMNPLEHGEVFVTNDGDETDQDIGTYERFLDTDIGTVNYMTTGRVYQSVLERERSMGYGGKCVEAVPHIPEEVIRRIKECAKTTKAEIILIEVGGTVGEYQNVLYLEAARMMRLENATSVVTMLVSYLPVPGHIGEMKTKPTQQATHLLMGAGLQPDFIIARGIHAVDEPRRKKLSVFCNVHPDDVISAPDVSTVYEVPLVFDEQKLGEKVLKRLHLRPRKGDIAPWRRFVGRIHGESKPVRIGIVGKYFTTGNFVLSDVYLSVIESIKHACWHHNRKPELTWLNSEEYEQDPKRVSELSKFDGVIIPGGFGTRGVEGKIKAIEYLRKKKIPYLGLCYGMQLACIEFARNVAGLKDANTTEVAPKTKHPVIDVMAEQKKNIAENRYGGTMRLGAYHCALKKGTKAALAYGKAWQVERGPSGVAVIERHRHRFEFNNAYREAFEKKGMVFSGVNPKRDLVEIIELKDHPFFVGVQFHPEFKSRPLRPHPLFRDFIAAAIR